MNKANRIYIDRANISFCYYLYERYGKPDKNSRIQYTAKDLNKLLNVLKTWNNFANNYAVYNIEGHIQIASNEVGLRCGTFVKHCNEV